MRLPPALDGLAFRIGLLLTLALFPIGLIAVSLSQQLAEAAARREEGAILALTAEAAASEESVIGAARNMARGLAAAVPSVRSDPLACNALFGAFTEASEQYSFAGYIDAAGTVACGSARTGADVSQTEMTRQMQADPQSRIEMMVSDRAIAPSLFHFLEPLRDADGAYAGYVTVSLRNDRSLRKMQQLPDSRPLTFLTFNSDGGVLAASQPLEDVALLLPGDTPLTDFVGGPRRTFSAVTVSGEERAFAVVPVIAGRLYAMGSWPQRTGGLEPAAITPLVFVALMWMVSLGVAYMAVHRLAIRNIMELRQRMNGFIATRRIERAPEDTRSRPLEFREIGRTWEELAETVVRDEAELENIIHSRTVLLKEVHHRVKNNLQLIASIVSMKLRKAATPEARVALKEVQMRVMSIATVHQRLYSTPAQAQAQVQADELLKGIIDRLVEAGTQSQAEIRVETGWEAVALYPDQAVPLSLLASEAVTNALKYMGVPKSGQPWLSVRLTRVSADAAELVVANSRGVPLLPPEQSRGTGLGMKLIRAFALQMRGSVDIVDSDPDAFEVRVGFRAIDFDHSPQAAVDLDHLE